MKKRTRGFREDFKSAEVMEKTKLAEERKGILIIIFGIIAIFGFLALLMPIREITGNVIGEIRGNLYGVYFLVLFLICWSAIAVLWNLMNRQKQEVDVKKLIKQAG